jgi:hypothetical protein
MKVVELDDYRDICEPFLCVCVNCCAEFYSQCPEGTNKNMLECPECGCLTAGKVGD